MEKVRLMKLIRQKVYLEKERDKIFFNVPFFFIFLIGSDFKARNYPGIKEIKKIGWSNSSGWEKFNCISDWILIVVLIIYLFLFIYFFIRIQTIQQKLIRLNQRLLEELDNLSDTDIKVK